MKETGLVKKLKLENLSLKSELDQRTKELSFFIESGKALTSSLEFKKILGVIMERAQRLIKCEGWSLMLFDREIQELRFVSTKGSRKNAQVKKARIDSGRGIAGWVAKNGRPVILPDAPNDRRFNKNVDQITRFKVRSVLCVPIMDKKEVVGVLEMFNKRGDVPFNVKDKDLLMQLVDQAAIALERCNLYQQMTDLATTDDLTKLFNFRYLDKTLDQEIARCERYGSILTLIFCDMDYFKQVNDNHGHLMGSRVLVEVAQILLKNLRTVDVVSRYGGDEFVVLLPETTGKTALRITQRIQRSISNHVFLQEDGLKIHLTASFGISGFPEHSKSKKDLIRQADQAMYRAKNTGRNRICVTEGGPLGDQEGYSSLVSGMTSDSFPGAKSRSPRRSKRRSAIS